MIQSTIKNEESKPVDEWPKLMVADDGDVVLFVGKTTGMLVYHAGVSKRNYFGQYGENWCIGSFKPFTGTIELKNE